MSGWITTQAEIDLETVARKLVREAFPHFPEPMFDGVRWATLVELRAAIEALDKQLPLKER